jgi:histidine ammonia-lyase
VSAATRHVILLDGSQLTRRQVVQVASGEALIGLAPDQLARVQRTADFLSAQVKRGEPIYGVTTGFGSNADKLLGAHRVREDLPGAEASKRDAQSHERTLMEELQHNLVVTHAVCVGKPLAAEVVRAMLAIRVNTLMRGHSGIRATTLQALAELLNHGVVPVIPEKGSVGASGDLAPLSHLAIVLLGEGEAFYQGQRMSGGEALKRAGLAPVKLSFKGGKKQKPRTTDCLASIQHEHDGVLD